MREPGLFDVALILGMFIVTFGVRILPLAYAHRLTIPHWLREALSYVPVAALTAIIAPIIVYGDGALASASLSNHKLWAACLAFAMAYYTRNMLLTVTTGMAAFFLMKWFGLGTSLAP